MADELVAAAHQHHDIAGPDRPVARREALPILEPPIDGGGDGAGEAGGRRRGRDGAGEAGARLGDAHAGILTVIVAFGRCWAGRPEFDMPGLADPCRDMADYGAVEG